MGNIIWITGTGTGVGKSILTSLITYHFRRHGIEALACKPYASGGWDDAELLMAANENVLRREEITPIFCKQPVAPIVGLDQKQAAESLHQAHQTVRHLAKQCEVLFVEGIGGAAVPVSKNQTIATAMAGLTDGTIIVGQNRLGVLNEILLTNHYLQTIESKPRLIILMEVNDPDPSSESNQRTLQEVLSETTIISLPFMELWDQEKDPINNSEKKIRKTLVQIRNWVNLFSADTARPNKTETGQ